MGIENDSFYSNQQQDGVSPRVTRDSSLFFTPIQKTVMRDETLLRSVENGEINMPIRTGDITGEALSLFHHYTQHMNSSDRGSLNQSLQGFKTFRFPYGYNALVDVIIAQETASKSVRELADQMRTELQLITDLPQHVTTSVILVAHDIDPPQPSLITQVSSSLEDELKKAFHPGHRNIIFLPNTNPPGDSREKFSAGLTLTDSYVLAHTYMHYYDLMKGHSNDPNFMNHLRGFSRVLRTETSDLAYKAALFEALDRLQEQGYRPEMQSEENMYYTFNKGQPKIDTLAARKKVVEEAIWRDRGIARQLTDIVTESDPGIPLRIGIPIGAMHAPLLNYLPIALQPRTTVNETLCTWYKDEHLWAIRKEMEEETRKKDY